MVKPTSIVGSDQANNILRRYYPLHSHTIFVLTHDVSYMYANSSSSSFSATPYPGESTYIVSLENDRSNAK